MKEVPTTWDETRFIDGYPGRYVILARRHGDKWYVAGVNAQQQALTTTITLPMLEKGSSLDLYADNPQLVGAKSGITYKKGVKVTIPGNGGVVIVAKSKGK